MGKRSVFGIATFVLVLMLVLFSISLVSLSVNAAGETTLFSGNVQSGSQEIDGETAVFAVVTGLVRVQYMGITIIAKEGECKTDSGLKFCASNINEFGADVGLYASVAYLEVEKKVSNKEYSVGELIPVSVVVSNTGKLVATGVKLKDDVSGFDVVNPIGCNLEGDYLVFNTQISSGASASCVYKLKAKSDKELVRIAEVTYFDGLKDNSASASARIQMKPFGFSVASGFDTNKLNVGSPNWIKFNFTLKSARDTKVNTLAIEFPDNLFVRKENGELISNGKFTWTGMVNGKDSVEFKFNVSVLRIENKSVSVVLDFISDSIGYQTNSIPVKIDYNEPVISFKAMNFSNQKNKNTIYIRNPNDFTMKGVMLKLSSLKVKFDKNSIDVGNIENNQEVKAGDIEFSAPKGTSSFFADLGYKTGDGREFKVSKVFNFNVDINATGEDLTPTDNLKTDSSTGSEDVVATKKEGFWCRNFGWLIASLCN